MADVDRLIGFMAIMQMPFMNDPDALAYIEEVKTVLKQAKAQESGWISVKERKPETKGQYLVAAIEAGHYRRFGIVSFTDHFVMNGHRSYWKVTHWMPIPEMPKEET